MSQNAGRDGPQYQLYVLDECFAICSLLPNGHQVGSPQTQRSPSPRRRSSTHHGDQQNGSKRDSLPSPDPSANLALLIQRVDSTSTSLSITTEGPYVAFVTSARVVGHAANSAPIYQATDVMILPVFTSATPVLAHQKLDEERAVGTPTYLRPNYKLNALYDRYIGFIQSQIRSKHFYFSYGFDLTNSYQRQAEIKSSGDLHNNLASVADERFFWNKAAISDLIERNLWNWVVVFMQGLVCIPPSCILNGERLQLMLISRRCRHYQGCRFTRRGVDATGNVANFVETEQIIVFPDNSVTSYVIIRGSIPLFWSSPVSMKYAPKVYIRKNETENLKALTKHFTTLTETYGKTVVINLVDKKREQQQLGIAFKETLEKSQQQDKSLSMSVRYVWFDFHHECRNMQYQNLSLLLREVEDDFFEHRYFRQGADGSVLQKQAGVLRVNCMDNLDRTNVVQSLFGRRSLLMQLNISSNHRSSVLDTSFRDFEQIFKSVWGDNADAISFMYAGTGALKTDFTRTGKRTFYGSLQDGYNSVMRYILNNFDDGRRQDSVDFLLRRYAPVTSKPSPYADIYESRTKSNVLMTKVAVAFALSFCFTKALSSSDTSITQLAARSAGLLAVGISAALYYIIRKDTDIGKRFVCRPRLLQHEGTTTKWDP